MVNDGRSTILVHLQIKDEENEKTLVIRINAGAGNFCTS